MVNMMTTHDPPARLLLARQLDVLLHLHVLPVLPHVSRGLFARFALLVFIHIRLKTHRPGPGARVWVRHAWQTAAYTQQAHAGKYQP